MRNKRTYTLLLCLTAVLLIGIFGIFRMGNNSTELFEVSIQCSDGEEAITCWENKDGQLYVFLPAYAQLQNAQFSLLTHGDVIIGDKVIHDGTSCDVFSFNTAYEITYRSFGRLKRTTITFMQSANIPALFIETESGSYAYIHANRDNEETGKVSLYTDSGELDYQGAATSISGRGNYTWRNSEKKPYNIVLAEAADLLGMGQGSKWILLADADDNSHMRNKIVYDFAKKIGLPYSPESQWVDLYMNGEYVGLYLLCEYIEVSPDRVDISQTNGAILALERGNNLAEKNDVYFSTQAGLAVEICAPSQVSEIHMLELKQKVQSVENAIIAKNGLDPITEKSWEVLIDLDSWTKKYLIEEVFGNHDAGFTSQYFYYAENMDKLYAGPVWDYDLSMGNEKAWQLAQPRSFFANRPSAEVGMDTPWFCSLYQKDVFYRSITELYQSVFLPELRNLLEITVYDYAGQINQASAINGIRWEDSNTEVLKQVDEIRAYMEERIAFLNSIWCEEKEYCVVRACQQFGGYFAYYVVLPGEQLGNLPQFDDTEDSVFLGWYYEDTDEPFHDTQPIYQDTAIYAKWQDKTTKKMNQLIKLVPLGVIAVVGVSLLLVEIRRIKKSG